MKIPHYHILFLVMVFAVSAIVFTSVGHAHNLSMENSQLQARYTEETAALQAQIDTLGETVTKQAALLQESDSTLSEYLTAGNTAEANIDAFKEDYETMVVSYIDKNMKELKVSRGGSDNATFKEDVVNLRAVLEAAEAATLEEEEVTTELVEKSAQLSGYLDSLPTYWPVDASIGSDFGMRLHPVYHRYIRHTGVDMGAPKGTPIYAAGSGVVTATEYRSGYGKLVVIDHGNGYTTYYAHCSEYLVEVGDRVTRGQAIAKVGRTGTATESHLHFEVRINNTPVDPKRFISR